MTDWREMGETIKFIKEVSDKRETLITDLCNEPSLVDPVARSYYLGAYEAYTQALAAADDRANIYNSAVTADSPAWGEHQTTSSFLMYLRGIYVDLRGVSTAPATMKDGASQLNNLRRGWTQSTNHMLEIVDRLKHPEKTSAKAENDADLLDVAPRWEEFLD